MAPKSTKLTTKVESGSPYQLDHAQTLKASQALLKHISAESKSKSASENKQSLLGDDDDEDISETPVWLTLTTKKHIIDKKRLKPAKITLPHPIALAEGATICLITADPQRAFKDVVESPAFPAELRSRITRVIGVSKIKAKYSQYEAQRQLLAEHEVFLADDRIITQLPKLLGKTFYKSSAKRPIPISIAAERPRTDGKKIARAKGETNSDKALEPKKFAAEIEKTLSCALVALSPSTNTSVRVGLATDEPAQIAANVEKVVEELIERFVVKKWRGVRGIHIKGPNTAALPIWLADELWTDEADVLEDAPEVAEGAVANVGKKRKAGLSAVPEESKKAKIEQAKKIAVVSEDGNLDAEIKARKEKLKKQKEEASAEVAEPLVEKKVAKKAKKSKA